MGWLSLVVADSQNRRLIPIDEGRLWSFFLVKRQGCFIVERQGCDQRGIYAASRKEEWNAKTGRRSESRLVDR